MMRRKPSCVAIWIGEFIDEGDADEYLFTDFGRHFGCTPDENNVPEFTVFAAAVLITELLRPFSSSVKFLDAATALACEKGIMTATTAVIYYHTHFDSEAPPSSDAQLSFLGNVEW